MSLSAANQARLQKALDTTYRFDGHTDHPIFCTLKEYLDEHAVSFSTGSARKYTWEYIKRKQEREKLSNAEIEALENERKTTYQACFKDALSHEVGNSVGFANCHGGHYQGQGGGKKSLKYHKIPQRYKRFVSIKGLNSHRVKHSAPRKLTIDQKMRQLKRKRRKNNRYQFARQIDPPPPIHVPEARKLTDDEKLDILHNLELVALRAEQKRLKEKLEWQYRVDKDIMDKLKIHLED